MVQFVNVRELKISPSNVIRRSRKGDVVVTVRGKPKAVIHALGGEDLEEYLAEYSPVFLRKMERAMQEAREGRVYSYKEVFGRPQPGLKVRRRF